LTKDEADALTGYYLHAFDALQALELLLTNFDKSCGTSDKIVGTIILHVWAIFMRSRPPALDAGGQPMYP
jgi:hypothetical protein